ncbi:hypothetical protein HF1_01530 [Mycoplasma haemofelis str. Langford 1]|uniref:Uncharacterized protein n=1 Tax=Mycoplasma haemofelis (strain Langford 1) TaxID=941640 RepID=E8ZKJ5_MYCHL|nr:hypothetical protein [Mycoplasma haemofelis]CBY92161.1 hypothetical protein HF1_01530 [Mycoplasma haemofelis str. Langford 1]
MSPSKICSLTVAGGGATSAATYGMYYQTNSSRSVKTEINEILLTDASEDEAWGQHYEEYKKAPDTLKIKDLDDSAEDKWKKGIKIWCATALETGWTSNNFYSSLARARKWCIDTESIGARITRTLGSNKEIIQDGGDWEAAWDTYNTGKNNNEIDALKADNKASGKDKIKPWCIDNKGLHASSNKKLKDDMKAWCTKDKASS